MTSPPTPPPGSRKSLGVHMRCCHVYTYAHLNVAGTAYVGWCPKCARQVRIEVVSEGGSTSRIFEAQ